MNRRGMCIDPAHEPWLTAAGLTDIDAVFRYSIGKKLDKPGLESFRERGRITLIDKSGRPRTYFMKRYIHPPMSQQIRRIREAGSARTTAEREAHFARKLATFGVPAVRMAAFGGEHRGWREFRSFSIAEAIDGVSLETLAQQLERGDAMALSAPDRHEMIRQIARITSAMHRQLLFHRDLYLCHVFLTHNDDGAIVLQLIDLARMIGRPWLRRRWVAKDLASLDYSSPRGVVTRTDRFRFLRDYYAYVWNSSTPAIRRAFLRGAMLTIASRRNRIARHDAKRLRRLGATSVKPDVAPRDFARQT